MTSMIKTNVFFDCTDFQVPDGDYVPPMSNVLVLELTGVGSVREVFMMHVGGTRGVTSSTDHIMNIHARTTLTVECIRGYYFYLFV
jgi:hypothetical protein